MSDSSQGGPLAYPALPNFRGAGEIPFSRLRAYQHFILRNAPRVAAVERISRGLAFTSGGVVALLDHTSWKGRFGDNLYLQEFALMVINIVANFHTAVFSLSGLFKPSKMTPLHTRLQNAFFRAQLKRLGNDSTYGMLILAFQLITYVEKVAEISLAKRGEDVKWNGIVAIEVVKSTIRIVCFWLLGYKGPLQPRLVPERDLSLAMPKASGLPTPPLSATTSATNMDASMSASNADITNMQTAISESEALDLVGHLHGYERISEVAFIMRPVVYSLLLRKAAADGTLKTSWVPYLTSLGMDLFALGTQLFTIYQGTPTWLEEDELIRRMHLMLYYLLREPVFSKFTAPALGRFFRYAGRRPVVNLTTFILMEYTAYWKRLYFYSAASS